MGRKKMDKLALDMIQCKKDGFGVHYGAWRAAQYEKNQHKTIKTIPEKPKGYKHTCLNCGKEFYSKRNNNRKYCSEECKDDYYRSQKEKKVYEKTCPICGKDFVSENYHTKYCCELCVKVARAQMDRERKAKGAKANG